MGLNRTKPQKVEFKLFAGLRRNFATEIPQDLHKKPSGESARTSSPWPGAPGTRCSWARASRASLARAPSGDWRRRKFGWAEVWGGTFFVWAAVRRFGLYEKKTGRAAPKILGRQKPAKQAAKSPVGFLGSFRICGGFELVWGVRE